MVRNGDRLSMCVRLRMGGACSNGYVAYTQGRRIRGRSKEVPYLDVYQAATHKALSTSYTRELLGGMITHYDLRNRIQVEKGPLILTLTLILIVS